MSWPMMSRCSAATTISAVAGASRIAVRLNHAAAVVITDSFLTYSLPKSKNSSKFNATKTFQSSRFASAMPSPEPDSHNNINNNQSTDTKSKTSLEQHKNTILSTSLTFVHEKGWTEDAIAAATLSLNLPPTLMGLIPNRSYDLISFFMKQSNERLQHDIEHEMKPRWFKDEGEVVSVAMKLEEMLKARLQYLVPFVRSKRWHEAMAVGVSTPNNAMSTAALLDEMTSIIIDAALEGKGGPSHLGGGIIEKAAITTVYASTELHMLADESLNYEDTWTFLKERIMDLERVALVTSSSGGSSGSTTSMSSSDAMVAASAVASSLGGAVLSLAAPAASVAASTVAPRLMSFVQQVQPLNTPMYSPQGVSDEKMAGTRPSDYYDEDEKINVDKVLDGLPPFEEDLKNDVKTK